MLKSRSPQATVSMDGGQKLRKNQVPTSSVCDGRPKILCENEVPIGFEYDGRKNFVKTKILMNISQVDKQRFSRKTSKCENASNCQKYTVFQL